jgi:hypothetical protein
MLQAVFTNTSVFQLRMPLCGYLNEMLLCFTDHLVDFMHQVFPRVDALVFALIEIYCFLSIRRTERMIYISSSSV